MKKYLVVFNNRAGRKRAFWHTRLIFRELSRANFDFKFVYIDVLPLLQDIDSYDVIIVVGGDGSINSVLPFLINSDKILGIVPCGTANLLSSRLGIPDNTKKALKAIFAGKIKKIDTASVNGNPFVLRLGFGYDAQILNTSPQILKNIFGYSLYFFQGIVKAIGLKSEEYQLILDGKKILTSASCLIVANAANMFSNMFSVGKKSRIDDAMLDVFILKAKNFVEFVFVFFQIIFNIKKSNRLVFFSQAQKIEIQTICKSLHIDGEQSEKKDNLSVEIVPDSLTVFVP